MADLLIADVFHALTGEAHPSRPNANSRRASRYAELAERLRAQRERLAAAPAAD